MNNEMTLSQAAEKLGINLQALRQRVRRRNLTLKKIQGPKGFHYVVTPEDWERLEAPFTVNVDSTGRLNVESTQHGAEPERESLDSRAPSTQKQPADGFSESATVNVDSTVQSTGQGDLLQTLAQVANKTLDRNRELEEKLEELRFNLTEALEQKARAERQMVAIGSELGAYQRALSEAAESLAEQRARVIQAETQNPPGAVPLDHQADGLKLALPTPAKGWGSRVKRWLGFRQVG